MFVQRTLCVVTILVLGRCKAPNFTRASAADRRRQAWQRVQEEMGWTWPLLKFLFGSSSFLVWWAALVHWLPAMCSSRKQFWRTLRYAPCPLPFAPCPLPLALLPCLCTLPLAPCPLPLAPCRLPLRFVLAPWPLPLCPLSLGPWDSLPVQHNSAQSCLQHPCRPLCL